MNVIRKNNTLSTMSCQRAALIALPLIGALAQTNSALAQVIPSGEGTSTVVDAVGGTLEISGGQLSKDNSNLFHSFERFDLSAEQTANFVTNANVQNVVGSIRGGAASTIDGTLQVSGSNANLYLMNPAGILFGPNARLNLSGGITATTADGIDFADQQFVAGDRANYSGFIGTPTAFQFTQERAGAVVNRGELAVDSSQSISLVGGTVVNTGSLKAPDGTVTIAAVEGENLVRLSQGEQLLSLEVAAVESGSSANVGTFPASISKLLTGGGLSDATDLLTDADGTVRLASTGTVVSERGEVRSPQERFQLQAKQVATLMYSAIKSLCKGQRLTLLDVVEGDWFESAAIIKGRGQLRMPTIPS